MKTNEKEVREEFEAFLKQGDRMLGIIRNRKISTELERQNIVEAIQKLTRQNKTFQNSLDEVCPFLMMTDVVISRSYVFHNDCQRLCWKILKMVL